jgi:hypothetical protein
MKRLYSVFIIFIVFAALSCRSTTENIAQTTIDIDKLRKMTALTIDFSATVEEIQITNADTTVYKGYADYILPGNREKQYLGQLTWDSTASNP